MTSGKKGTMLAIRAKLSCRYCEGKGKQWEVRFLSGTKLVDCWHCAGRGIAPIPLSELKLTGEDVWLKV